MIPSGQESPRAVISCGDAACPLQSANGTRDRLAKKWRKQFGLIAGGAVAMLSRYGCAMKADRGGRAWNHPENRDPDHFGENFLAAFRMGV